MPFCASPALIMPKASSKNFCASATSRTEIAMWRNLCCCLAMKSSYYAPDRLRDHVMLTRPLHAMQQCIRWGCGNVDHPGKNRAGPDCMNETVRRVATSAHERLRRLAALARGHPVRAGLLLAALAPLCR